MDDHSSPPPDAVARFLERVDALAGEIASEADREAGFPEHAVAALRDAGALTAALPVDGGGLDLGCGRQGAPVARLFQSLGRGSVAVGRLIEGHVNALRLVWRYGDAEQRRSAAADAGAGKLFGLWVTDGASPLRARDGTLHGGKAFCSGAGHVARALVTAERADGATVMLVVNTADGASRRGTTRPMAGVRGAVTADMSLDGIRTGAPVGAPGDYLRQPEFSAGAWRGSAVATGALEALSFAATDALVSRGRHRNPHQAERIGRLLIARDTCRLWTGRAAVAADGHDAGAVVAAVNLARIAVETACLEAMTTVQRALGLPGLAAGSRVERLLRDLATYLRQPAPDETLTEAAIWSAEHRA